jgi:hypothetical protein
MIHHRVSRYLANRPSSTAKIPFLWGIVCRFTAPLAQKHERAQLDTAGAMLLGAIFAALFGAAIFQIPTPVLVVFLVNDPAPMLTADRLAMALSLARGSRIIRNSF